MRILAFPDLHAPYTSEHAFNFVSGVAKSFKPDVIVSLGDEADFASVSRWGQNPNLQSPGDEVKSLREALKPWFARFPKVLCCNSNHNARPLKKAFKAGLPRDFLKAIPEVLGAPKGWEWADSHELDGVIFEHGEGCSAAIHSVHALRNSYGKSVMIGHIHTKQLVDWHVGKQGRRAFAAYAGCLINPHAEAFDYARHGSNRPCLGCVIIENGIPTIVPMGP